MSCAFDPESCPGCPNTREGARRTRQVEERQDRQDGYLLDIARKLDEVLRCVRPQVEGTAVKAVPHE